MPGVTIQSIGAITPGVLTGAASQNIVTGTASPNSKVTIKYLNKMNDSILLGETTTSPTGAFSYTFSAENMAQLSDAAINIGAIIDANSIIATSSGETSPPISFLSLPNSKTLGSNGISVQDLIIGAGDSATANKLVVVDYTGFLPNGTKFDSSISRGIPFAFQLGAGKVISGWDQGVTGMQPGAERILDIPSSLAYGSQSVGSIPANSTLVFDVKLLNVFDPVAALVQWEAARGQKILSSDAAALIFGGSYSTNNAVYSPLPQHFGNNLDLSSQTNTVMGFALASGESQLKASQKAVTMLFGGSGASILDGSGSIPQFLFAGTGDATLIGGDSFDWLQAGNGANIIAAGAGNDLIVIGMGSDKIDGGAGFDTVILSRKPDQCISTKTDSGYTLAVQYGDSQITELLNNVERVKLGGNSIAFDINENAGQAYRIYQAAFDRKPDSSGLGFWINALDNGVPLKSVADGFLGSVEFQSIYGSSSTNSSFVAALYNNVLHRGGEQAGVEFWTGVLDAGASRADVLAGFSESAENKAGVLGSIKDGIHYTDYLG